jgi:hypothetical protein
MARPYASAKQSVDLAPNSASGGASGAASGAASSGPRVSRIRRDPPPPAAKERAVDFDPEEREQWAVIIGIATFGLAIFAIVLAFGSYSDWSPANYRVELNTAE